MTCPFQLLIGDRTSKPKWERNVLPSYSARNNSRSTNMGITSLKNKSKDFTGPPVQQ